MQAFETSNCFYRKMSCIALGFGLILLVGKNPIWQTPGSILCSFDLTTTDLTEIQSSVVKKNPSFIFKSKKF